MNRENVHILLVSLLRPIARFCLRYGLQIQDLHEACKRAIVLEAQSQVAREAGTANISRLSAATGIHRRDVTRLTAEPDAQQEPQGLTTRIIGQWQHDRRFSTPAGRPRPLTVGVDGSEFHALVAAVSKDLHAGTIFKELERLGLVESRGDTVRLLSGVFVPRADTVASYRMLARDASSLFSAVEANIHDEPDPAHLHGTTSFDNLRQSALPEIRAWLLAEGSKFHRRVREHLSSFDLDLSPPSAKESRTGKIHGGGKVVCTTVSFTSGGEDA